MRGPVCVCQAEKVVRGGQESLHSTHDTSAVCSLPARPPARPPCRSRLSPGDHAPEEAPQPCARDRASMVAVGPGKLLLVGGADLLNRRLDDAWLFDLET